MFAVVWLPLPFAAAQLAGSRAGVESHSAGVADLPLLDRQTAETYIAIDGRAEVRVRATEIRIVLAITSEGDTAQECRQAIDASIERLKAAWLQIEVPEEKIVTDFISVLPRRHWNVEQQEGVDVGVERKSGYRMQTNLHLAVPHEARAMQALSAAFEQNVTDIIAFDYWNDDLNEIKAQARQKALEAAREKADVLLAAVFDGRPPAINVQEQTTVRYPESLYHSFTNVAAEEVTPPFRRDMPFIHMYRPRNTYYRGLYPNADVQPRELPMTPEISVVSSVRIYFQSPA
ncbi:MAG TPA: SIMPL domain-containing protein, partial [Verrucomicrobiales bacterium]|nr:SIMPL domain-containing protein [Verrucomicrobiales bacterium]